MERKSYQNQEHQSPDMILFSQCSIKKNRTHIGYEESSGKECCLLPKICSITWQALIILINQESPKINANKITTKDHEEQKAKHLRT